jgi:phosphoribosylamine--glycine ligase
LKYIGRIGAPIVIKADGLAAGKGVIVANLFEEAIEGVEKIMGGAFGPAGNEVVIEEYLEGQEVSLLCFCDGKTACRWSQFKTIRGRLMVIWV